MIHQEAAAKFHDQRVILLVALIACDEVQPAALVVLEPSLPAELQGFDPEVIPIAGTFDPAAVDGAASGDLETGFESSFALGERRRGISVPSIQVPLLVIAG